jgi:hypothetical protein
MESGVWSRSHALKGDTASSSASASVAGTLGTATVLMVQAGRVQASGISIKVVADSKAPAGTQCMSCCNHCTARTTGRELLMQTGRGVMQGCIQERTE